nr:hypothetical protein [Tanacetum cinerariifolium]
HAFREKHHQLEDIQELLRKLLNDLQSISEELAEYINLPSWNCLAFYDDDDDDDEESFIPLRDTLSELPLVEDLNLTPSESEDLSEDLSDIKKIKEADIDPEEEIRLVEKLLYDNSSHRPPKEFNSENSNAAIESFSPSPIPVEGSDSLMEEIDIFLAPEDSIPSGIENDDYDSEGDILFLEELLSNDSFSLPEIESFHFDVPSSPRPPAKPPDDGIYFEPDTGLLTAKVVGDISKHYVLMPRLLPTQPTICPMIDTLLPFSSKNENKVHLLSHRGFKASQLISNFSESPMVIYGGNIPILDVPFLYFYPL